jgi:predicted amidohydrolase
MSDSQASIDPRNAVPEATGVFVAVGQFGPGPNPAGNVDAIRELVEAAAENGAKIVVLPEYSSAFCGALGDWVNTFAEPLTGPFVTAMRALAAECDIAVVVGLLEAPDDEDEDTRPFNTVVAINSSGDILARYRKVHLFDAFGSMESDWIQPGDAEEAPEICELAGLTVGLQTCYDLRFPEVTRRLVDAGAELVAIPSEWIAGPKKAHHWVALIAARAIENLVFVAAADQIAPVAVGMSRVISPLGETLIDMGQTAGIAMAEVFIDVLTDARRANPALQLRRYGVSPL